MFVQNIEVISGEWEGVSNITFIESKENLPISLVCVDIISYKKREIVQSLLGSNPLTIRLSDSLMVRGYQPRKEDNEFDPGLGNFVLPV